MAIGKKKKNNIGDVTRIYERYRSVFQRDKVSLTIPHCYASQLSCSIIIRAKFVTPIDVHGRSGEIIRGKSKEIKHTATSGTADFYPRAGVFGKQHRDLRRSKKKETAKIPAYHVRSGPRCEVADTHREEWGKKSAIEVGANSTREHIRSKNGALSHRRGLKQQKHVEIAEILCSAAAAVLVVASARNLSADATISNRKVA